MEYSIKQNHKGNALFLILIAVALFGALSYAITQSTRGGGDITKEKALLDQAVLENCVGNVEAAVTRIQVLNNCADSEISYETSTGINPNPLAPADKSCHVFDNTNGGGAYECGTYTICDLTALSSIGDTCGSTVYAGIYNSDRIYTTTSVSFNSALGHNNTNLGTVSFDDGLSNTATMLAQDSSPSTAAGACRSLGPEWYLPAVGEFEYLRSNNASIGGFMSGSFVTSTWNALSFTDVAYRSVPTGGSFTSRTSVLQVMCVRKD